MSDNWSEIVDIMHSVLCNGIGHKEKKIALESCLRILGWRTSNGSMKTEYKLYTGKIVDVVLGRKEANGTFHSILPILIHFEEPDNDLLDLVTSVMSETNVNNLIVTGTTFDLYHLAEDTHKATRICKIEFEPSNKNGLEITSLLSAHSFSETHLIDYFDSLYKNSLPKERIKAIIKSIVEDPLKTTEVLRFYLEYEGFEDKDIDQALKDIEISISLCRETTPNKCLEKDVTTKPEQDKLGHDNTRFSLNGGAFLSKKKFVLNVVAQYVKDHPTITLEELELRFPSSITSKTRGVVRTWEQVKKWAARDGQDILTRYSIKDNERIVLSDGTEVVVNNQWGAKNFPRFLAIAKKLYDVSSNAPYEGLTPAPDAANLIQSEGNDNAQSAPMPKFEEGTNNGIQISLSSYNDFKTKK